MCRWIIKLARHLISANAAVESWLGCRLTSHTRLCMSCNQNTLGYICNQIFSSALLEMSHAVAKYIAGWFRNDITMLLLGAGEHVQHVSEFSFS